MHHARSLLVAFLSLAGAACAHKPPAAPPAPIVLAAVADFPVREVEGYVPYYADQKNKALAIDASKFKNQFAGAATTFAGPEGAYDIELTTLTETDGESTYRLKVNGTLVGTFQNPPERPNYGEASHVWKAVRLAPGAQIQVESDSHSNGKVPEGDAFGFSRGRWTRLVLTPAS